MRFSTEFEAAALGGSKQAAGFNALSTTPLDALDMAYHAPPAVDVYFVPGGVTVTDPGGAMASSGWSAFELAQAELAFQNFEAVAAVTFNTVTDPSQADFFMVQAGNGLVTNYLGYWYVPPTTGSTYNITFGGTTYSADGIGVFNDSWSNSALQVGGFDYITLIHEIGHGMGLAHPHDNSGGSQIMSGVTSDFGSYGDYFLNQGIYTTMSYNDGWPTGNGAPPSDSSGYQGTLMALDIAVLQNTYGVNWNTNAGDNTYVLPGANGVGTYYSAIWDAGGTDEIVYNGSLDAIINLNAATLDYSWSGGGVMSYVANNDGFIIASDGPQAIHGGPHTDIHGGFTIAHGVVIENATGGGGNDNITGNQATNILAGGAQQYFWDGGPHGAETDLFADVDGDGALDVLQVLSDGSVGVWLSDPGGLIATSFWGSGALKTDTTGDFNGDGKADLIQLYHTGAGYVWTSAGTHFDPYAAWGFGFLPTDKVGDFNGDGMDDVIQLYANGNAYVWTSNGSSFDPYAHWGTGVLPTDKIGDFDGDGMDDVIQLYANGNAYVWTSNGSGFDPYAYWGNGVLPTDQIGDFDGDGMDDVIQLYANGNAYVWLSNGSGFDPYAYWGSGVVPTDQIGDFNGDGMDDVIQLYHNGNAYVWLSNGAGFEPYSYWASGVPTDAELIDLNNDGRDDLLHLADNGLAYAWLSTGTGFGPKTEWGAGLTTGVGPSGDDTFVFQAGFGHDTILDFDTGAAGGDRIVFEDGIFADFASVLAAADDVNMNVVITYDANNTLTLANLATSDLDPADFSFA